MVWLLIHNHLSLIIAILLMLVATAIIRILFLRTFLLFFLFVLKLFRAIVNTLLKFH